MQTERRKFGRKFVDFKELYDRDGGRCRICGKRVALDQAILDHIVPTATLYLDSEVGHGFPSNLLHHDPINAQIAHRSYNESRGCRGPAQIRLC